MWRSVGVIAFGFVLIACLSFAGGAAVRAAVPDAFGPGGQVESIPVMLLILAYVEVFAAFGCWLTAALAPSRPMLHAMVLGALGLLFTGAMALQTWDQAPAWYQILALVLVLPSAWVGGRLREQQLEHRARRARV